MAQAESGEVQVGYQEKVPPPEGGQAPQGSGHSASSSGMGLSPQLSSPSFPPCFSPFSAVIPS